MRSMAINELMTTIHPGVLEGSKDKILDSTKFLAKILKLIIRFQFIYGHLYFYNIIQ